MSDATSCHIDFFAKLSSRLIEDRPSLEETVAHLDDLLRDFLTTSSSSSSIPPDILSSRARSPHRAGEALDAVLRLVDAVMSPSPSFIEPLGNGGSGKAPPVGASSPPGGIANPSVSSLSAFEAPPGGTGKFAMAGSVPSAATSKPPSFGGGTAANSDESMSSSLGSSPPPKVPRFLA